MDYLSVAEARKRKGLRLVLTAHMPGPWGEAAKAVLSARNIEYLPVEQRAMEPNEELFEWTGIRNAPIAIFDDEPPQSHWLDILLLAERIGSGPSLIPGDPLDRALMLGLSTEICGSDGLGWNRRLEMMGRPSTKNPDGSTNYDMGRMTRMYGVTDEAIARSSGRMASIMNGLARQLREQHGKGREYLVGPGLSAVDLHWATLSTFVKPLSLDKCAMPDFMYENYSYLTPELEEALDPILIEHRDMVVERHIRTPVDF